MKQIFRRKSFFPPFLWMGGSVVLGMSFVKLWYLARVLSQAERGESLFGRSAFIGFVLLDVILGTILLAALWKRYQSTLARPMAQVVEKIKQGPGMGSQGALELASRTCEEVRELAYATDALLTQVNTLIAQVQEVGQKLREASHVAFSTSKHQSSLLSDHVAASEEMTNTLRDAALTARQISDEGQAVMEVAGRTVELAGQGQQAVISVVQSMGDIRQAFQRSADKILALGKSSEHLKEVLKTIDRMIEDTKLMAFNAAIEAARAREEGLGFGVVAIEMKRLAEEVWESTEEMKEMIQEIQNASSLLVLGTEEDMHTVTRGERLAETAGDALTQIVAVTKLTTESAQRMAAIVRQHTTASEQVWQAGDAANQAVRSAALESKHFAVAAAELSLLAEGLRQLLAGFGGGEEWEQSS